MCGMFALLQRKGIVTYKALVEVCNVLLQKPSHIWYVCSAGENMSITIFKAPVEVHHL